MRFRKIRQISRWRNWRLMAVLSTCFVTGLFVGWTQNKEPIEKKSEIGIDHAPPDASDDRMYGEDGVEILGRRKLSVKAENMIPPFTKIPPNYEKNVLPPRAPTKKFRIEPYRIMERNKLPGNDGAHHFMLFIIKSSPIHTTRREVIRKTWGAVKEVDGLFLNTIFVVGEVDKNSPLQNILEKENEINGDLLQTGTPEGYRNLPLKVLSAMQWLVSRSAQISSDFYTFTDDDCVMNIANIVDFFGDLPFVNGEKASNPDNKDDSVAPSSVKEIQSIELYKKKKLNEVTLAPMEALQVSEHIIKEVKIASLQEVQSPGFESVQDEMKNKDSADDVAENLEIYAAMDPNAKIQIERTGDVDESLSENIYGDIPVVSNFRAATSNMMSESYNSAYKHNSYNLTEYLKAALKQNNPGAVFHKRRLVPDGLYCGFSYDVHGKPHRRMRDKWGVTREQYSLDVYPSFCHGGMYTMSGGLMTSIFAISTVTDYSLFHLEDVLVTGILREKTGVPDSKMIRRGTDPKVKPLMYYVWDSGPRVMLKMSRKWKFFNRPLFAKHFVMEALRNGKVVSWNNFGKS